LLADAHAIAQQSYPVTDQRSGGPINALSNIVAAFFAFRDATNEIGGFDWGIFTLTFAADVSNIVADDVAVIFAER
jgi:hypothetical protein